MEGLGWPVGREMTLNPSEGRNKGGGRNGETELGDSQVAEGLASRGVHGVHVVHGAGREGVSSAGLVWESGSQLLSFPGPAYAPLPSLSN